MPAIMKPHPNPEIRMPSKTPRVALVTGVSSGLGRAIAQRFLSDGHQVIGVARREEELKRLQSESNGQFAYIAGDAANTDIINQAFQLASEKFGRPADLVVANAGRGLGGSVSSADLTEFEDMLQINVTGALRLMQKASQVMLADLETRPFPRHPHDIIVIGSVVGRNVSPFSAIYGSTKFAVHALTEGLRREVGPKGIRVSLIEPGIVISGFQEGAGYTDETVQRFHDNWGPLPDPEHVADTIAYLTGLPPHVHANEIMLRPTKQDYP